MWATAGVHPHEAKDGLDGLEALLGEPEVVAVGECGLDFHYDHSPRDQQAEVFAAQIALAHAHDLTLVIHTREAWPETFDILAAEGVPARTVFHCFTGGPDEARRCLDLGAVLSFSGIVSFPSATDLHDAARVCPLDRLLVETDSPYLAPVPHRGQKNQPAWVVDVAPALAAVKGIALEDVAAATWDTASATYRLPARLTDETGVRRITRLLFAFALRPCVTSSECTPGQVGPVPTPAIWRTGRPAREGAGGRWRRLPIARPHGRPSPPPRAPPGAGRTGAARAGGGGLVATAGHRRWRPSPSRCPMRPLRRARVKRSRMAFAMAITLAALPVLVVDNMSATAETNERPRRGGGRGARARHGVDPVLHRHHGRPHRHLHHGCAHAPPPGPDHHGCADHDRGRRAAWPPRWPSRPRRRRRPPSRPPPRPRRPYGDPSDPVTWERLAQCESGGNWSMNTGNGYYGGLQFSLETWRNVGGSGYPHQASKAEQIKRGQILQARAGWGQWPHCARQLGYL